MQTNGPSPIEPLNYARRAPATSRLQRMIPGRATRRVIRVVYLVACFIGLFFVVRFLLHYRQMIEDAMKQK